MVVLAGVVQTVAEVILAVAMVLAQYFAAVVVVGMFLVVGKLLLEAVEAVLFAVVV